MLPTEGNYPGIDEAPTPFRKPATRSGSYLSE